MRKCACGCGQVLEGPASQRFVDDAHRMRARRSAERTRTEPEQNPNADPNEPEQRERPDRSLAATLERFVQEHGELAEPLAAAALALAERLDRGETSPALWASYGRLLTQLLEAEAAAGAEARALTFAIRAGCKLPAVHAASTSPDVHCATCCEAGRPDREALGRWLYRDGRPWAWLPSDEEIERQLAAGDVVIIAPV
jgi:hypothetical protein